MTREYMYMMEDVLENVLSVSSFSTMVSVAAYVFTALALYTIAQRREIKNAWLSWVPVLNVWILGSISDQYRYVVKGEIRSKRKVLLIVSIAQFVLTWVAVIRMIVSVVVSITNAAYMPDAMELVRQLLSSLLLFLPVAVLSILALVFRIMALYDLYSSCDPANNILYLVLSLIPGINTVTQPLFLFLCRNQDGGMPPRRQEAGPENFDGSADYDYSEL